MGSLGLRRFARIAVASALAVSWTSRPGGLDDGVVAYGIQFGEPG